MYQVQRKEHFILQISQSPKALPVLPGGVLDVTFFQDVPRSVMATCSLLCCSCVLNIMASFFSSVGNFLVGNFPARVPIELIY